MMGVNRNGLCYTNVLVLRLVPVIRSTVRAKLALRHRPYESYMPCLSAGRQFAAYNVC